MTGEDIIYDNTPHLPKSSIKVVHRSLVLAAVVCRGAIENEAGQSEADALQGQVLHWLTDLSLWDEVEPSEEKILRTPLGQLKQEDVILATWYVEGLAILAWALNQFEFPRHDQQVDSPDVADSVWFLREDADELVRTTVLRNLTEVEAGGELLYAIHVRLRDFLRHRTSKNFTDWIEQTWIEKLGLDAAHLIVDNDLAIDDKSISRVSDDLLKECANIAFERHRAVIWLLGRYPLYSQTPVDT